MPKRRLLLLASLPDLAKTFRVDREHREIARRVALARYGHAFEVVAVPALPREELDGLLESVRPTDLHIRCHGRPDALLLEDRHGREVALPFEDLEALLETSARRVRFLALEACFSASMAQRLARPSRLTLGMTDRINPDHTDAFFAAYYQALAGGARPRDAARDARLDLEILTPDGARAPCLFFVPSADALDTPHFSPDDDDDDAPLALAFPPLPRRASIAPALQLAGACAADDADEPILDQLDRAAWHGGLVHLDGQPGAGRTRALALWIDRFIARRGADSGLLLAWTFDPIGSDADPRHFLTALAERVGLPRLAPLDGSDHALGRALARALRHERFVLVLDGIDTLPGAIDEPTIERSLHPGLAALLRGLEGASNGACIFTAQRPLAFDDLLHARVPLPALGESDGSTWLWGQGLFLADPELHRLSDAFAGNRLALTWVARAPREALQGLAPAQSSTPPDPLAAALDALALDHGARFLLTALALADGHLDDGDLRRAWSAFIEAAPTERPRDILAALASLARIGLVRVERRSSGDPPILHLRAELAHPRLRHLALRQLTSAAPPEQGALTRLLGADPPPLVDDPHGLHALRQRLVALVALGHARAALRLYVTRIACYTHNHEDDTAPPDPAEPKGPPRQKQWSYIARDLGLHAIDLELLANFFARPFTSLRPDFDPPPNHELPVDIAFDVAFILHRAGLALRNLGRARDADAPFAAASRRYLALRDRERAATCANDHAELLVLLGDLPRAREVATCAVDHATAHLATQDLAPPLGSRAAQRLRQARVTVSLTEATLGHVLHRSGDTEAARAAFQRAEEQTLEIARADASAAPGEIPVSARFLFSRPGLYHWTFLLDQLEAAALHGEPLCAATVTVLDDRLTAASAWNARPGINKVSVSYSEYARARLLALRLLAPGKEAPKALIDAAEQHFARALDLLHRNHHTWALPELLHARARLRDRASDPEGAALDRREADLLAKRLGLPHAPVVPSPP